MATAVRLTQDVVEALERANTKTRLTQATVEVLDRYNTKLRLTVMAVEVLYQNPDFTLPVPSTQTFAQPLCNSNDAAVTQDAPPPMSARSDDSKPMAVRSDQAEVGGS